MTELPDSNQITFHLKHGELIFHLDFFVLISTAFVKKQDYVFDPIN